MKADLFSYAEFTKAIAKAKFTTPRLQRAQAVFGALPEQSQRDVIKTCLHLSGIPGMGSVTSFEVFVAVAHVAEWKEAQPAQQRHFG